MSLTDMVIMPGADYQDACEAIREKTGGTGYIRSGEMAEQIRGIPSGVELPTLTKPASAGDIARYKEAIDAEGTVIVGTLTDAGSGAIHSFTTTEITPNMVSYGGVSFMPSADFGAKTTDDRILRKNATIRLNVDSTAFGDAAAEDVAAGKTFTSMAGLKVTGTAAVGAEIAYEEIDGTDCTLSITEDADGYQFITLNITLTGTPKEIISIGGYFVGRDTDIAKNIYVSLMYPCKIAGIGAIAMWTQGEDAPYKTNNQTGELLVSGNTIQIVIECTGVEPCPNTMTSSRTMAKLYIGYTT